MELTYTEAELRQVLQRHQSWNQFWADRWFVINRRSIDRYTIRDRSELLKWLMQYPVYEQSTAK